MHPSSHIAYKLPFPQRILQIKDVVLPIKIKIGKLTSREFRSKLYFSWLIKTVLNRNFKNPFHNSTFHKAINRKRPEQTCTTRVHCVQYNVHLLLLLANTNKRTLRSRIFLTLHCHKTRN